MERKLGVLLGCLKGTNEITSIPYLKAAGFTSIRVYADRKFETPAPGEQRIYIKARKGKLL